MTPVSSPWARPLVLGGFAAVVTAAMIVAWLGALDGATTRPDTYVRTFASTSRPLDVALAIGDGQAYAALATDPTLARPDVYRSGAREAAYRAQRPLAGYAAWALSFGRPSLVAPALAALFVTGQAAAVAVAAVLLGRRRGRPELAVLLVVLPPALAALTWFGPEPLGLALLLTGILFWERRTPTGAWAAAGFFTLAALTRETNLLVPAALALAGLVRWSRPIRELAILTTPAVAWLAWAAVVRGRLGWWPWAGGSCRVAGAPFAGLGPGSGHWPSPPVTEMAMLVAVGVLVAACLIWRRGDDLTWVVVAFAVLAALLGECVWRRWEDFTRPLLPLFALGLVALASPVSARASTPSMP